MFYSETLQSPITELLVKRLYGINPVNDAASAKLIGIYPLTEVPNGYAVSHYEKENQSYTAVPHCVTIEEQQMVAIIRKMESTLASFRTRFGLPATQEVPQAINGYYPLYTSEAESDYNSSNGESHEHEIDGVTYYMPDAGVTLYHGTYDDGTGTTDSGDSGSTDSEDTTSDSDDSDDSGSTDSGSSSSGGSYGY